MKWNIFWLVRSSANTKRNISLKMYILLQVNASSVCTVEGQWGTFTQSQWLSASPGQNRKIPPKCRDRSGCPYCRPMYPREHQLTPTQGLQIQPGFVSPGFHKPALENNHLQPQGGLVLHKPAVENHMESEGNPVLHGELMCLRR